MVSQKIFNILPNLRRFDKGFQVVERLEREDMYRNSTQKFGRKTNVKFFTGDPYFWVMSFVGLSKSAKNDTYC